MRIIFEDNDIIVAVKPSGILSQQDNTGKESMISLLSEHTGSEVFPIHRLDRDVAGIMVFAKTKQSAAVLSKMVAEHSLIKEYIALIHGTPSQMHGEMRDLLFKDSTRNKSFVVKKPRKGVKEAILEYSVISACDDYSTVLIKLHTGRTHQIRVQFASRKMPLVGDRKYGAQDEFKNIGLWSYRLTFNHPKSTEKLTFSIMPDNFLQEYIKKQPT